MIASRKHATTTSQDDAAAQPACRRLARALMGAALVGALCTGQAMADPVTIAMSPMATERQSLLGERGRLHHALDAEPRRQPPGDGPLRQ